MARCSNCSMHLAEPLDEKISPDDEFEKKAVKVLKSGKAYYDRIIEKDGKPYLRAATPNSRRNEEMHDLPRELQEGRKKVSRLAC